MGVSTPDSRVAGHFQNCKTIILAWNAKKLFLNMYHTVGLVNTTKYITLNWEGMFHTSTQFQRFEYYQWIYLVLSLKCSSGFFAIEDTSTHWIEWFPLRTASEENYTRWLIDDVILRYGVPKSVVTNDETPFVSSVVQQITFGLDLNQTYTICVYRF